jgi:hypothetical protein
MRPALVLAALVFAGGGLVVLAADEPKPITAAEAVKSVGKPKVLVQLEVKKAKDRLEKRGIIYLDSEDDFKDPKNLGIAISAEAAAKFKEKGIADPAAHFQGKTIRVRGCVMRFEDRPYLPVHDPDQITVVEKK